MMKLIAKIGKMNPLWLTDGPAPKQRPFLSKSTIKERKMFYCFIYEWINWAKLWTFKVSPKLSPGYTRWTCYKCSIYFIKRFTGSPSISLKMSRNSALQNGYRLYINGSPANNEVRNQRNKWSTLWEINHWLGIIKDDPGVAIYLHFKDTSYAWS